MRCSSANHYSSSINAVEQIAQGCIAYRYEVRLTSICVPLLGSVLAGSGGELKQKIMSFGTSIKCLYSSPVGVVWGEASIASATHLDAIFRLFFSLVGRKWFFFLLFSLVFVLCSHFITLIYKIIIWFRAFLSLWCCYDTTCHSYCEMLRTESPAESVWWRPACFSMVRLCPHMAEGS